MVICVSSPKTFVGYACLPNRAYNQLKIVLISRFGLLSLNQRVAHFQRQLVQQYYIFWRPQQQRLLYSCWTNEMMLALHRHLWMNFVAGNKSLNRGGWYTVDIIYWGNKILTPEPYCYRNKSRGCTFEANHCIVWLTGLLNHCKWWATQPLHVGLRCVLCNIISYTTTYCCTPRPTGGRVSGLAHTW